MMQHWSDHLDDLRDGAKVLKLIFGRQRQISPFSAPSRKL
jgi:hypothetical protein